MALITLHPPFFLSSTRCLSHSLHTSISALGEREGEGETERESQAEAQPVSETELRQFKALYGQNSQSSLPKDIQGSENDLLTFLLSWNKCYYSTNSTELAVSHLSETFFVLKANKFLQKGIIDFKHISVAL